MQTPPLFLAYISQDCFLVYKRPASALRCLDYQLAVNRHRIQ